MRVNQNKSKRGYFWLLNIGVVEGIRKLAKADDRSLQYYVDKVLERHLANKKRK